MFLLLLLLLVFLLFLIFLVEHEHERQNMTRKAGFWLLLLPLIGLAAIYFSESEKMIETTSNIVVVVLVVVSISGLFWIC